MIRERLFRYYWALLLAVLFFVPISQFLGIRILIITLAASFFVGPPAAFRRFISDAWDKVLLFIVLALGIIYSEDKISGLRILETSFSLLAFPFVLSPIPELDEKKMNQLFYAFASGVLVVCLWCTGVAISNYLSNYDASVFFFEVLAKPIGLQPTYLAYYIIFTITFGLYIAWYYRAVPFSILFSAALLLFPILILTGAKTTFISVLLIFSFFILKYLLEPRTPDKNILFVSICIMLTTLFFLNSLDYWPAQGDYWARIALWKSAIVANPSPLFGVGTGDYKNVINQYYINHGLQNFAIDSYNAHNQFVQMYFSNGLVCVIIFVIVLSRPLYHALQSQHTLGILVFFPFLIYGVTEVFLGRYQGVVFFGMLQAIFMRYYASRTGMISLRS